MWSRVQRWLLAGALEFGLVLIGRAIDHLPYFLFSFEQLGRMGLGRAGPHAAGARSASRRFARGSRLAWPCTRMVASPPTPHG
jgi:hypothetical protein